MTSNQEAYGQESHACRGHNHTEDCQSADILRTRMSSHVALRSNRDGKPRQQDCENSETVPYRNRARRKWQSVPQRKECYQRRSHTE